MRATSSSAGVLVISLDFEMHWGVRDHWSVDDYRANLEGERHVVPMMLDLFQTYGIHATWATVGFLFFQTKQDLLAHVPSVQPTYRRAELSPYPSLHTLGENEQADPYHFAHTLIERIKATPHQELASHTFSHYFCLEVGQTIEAFRADLQAAVATAAREGIVFRSFVFPRNQFQSAYLAVCREMGFRCYRGNERSWIYHPKNEDHSTKLQRAIRLLDAYLPLTGHNTYALKNTSGALPMNIPSSRFFRPYVHALRLFESLRLRRILLDMTYAAKRGEVYHLWWHPHNFGTHMTMNKKHLERVLRHFKTLQHAYGMRSLTMAEAAEEALV